MKINLQTEITEKKVTITQDATSPFLVFSLPVNSFHHEDVEIDKHFKANKWELVKALTLLTNHPTLSVQTSVSYEELGRGTQHTFMNIKLDEQSDGSFLVLLSVHYSNFYFQQDMLMNILTLFSDIKY